MGTTCLWLVTYRAVECSCVFFTGELIYNKLHALFALKSACFTKIIMQMSKLHKYAHTMCTFQSYRSVRLWMMQQTSTI